MKIACQASAGLSVSARISIARAVRIGCRVDDVKPISALDAVIFQTSQRNWGVPAELKNAIDYLFHEWRGKPALIVTMGGTGGNQAREHLTTSLTGIGMKMVPEGVSLKFPSREFVMDYSFGGEKQLELDGTRSDGLWSAEREVLAAKFEELVALLKKPITVRSTLDF